MTAVGMPVISQISRDLRVTETVAREMFGAGAIDFSKVDKAVSTISSTYGRTAGTLGRRSRVLQGLMPRL